MGTVYAGIHRVTKIEISPTQKLDDGAGFKTTYNTITFISNDGTKLEITAYNDLPSREIEIIDNREGI